MRRMEALLTLYAQPYAPHFPVVCFDERPCFLLGDVVEGLAPQPGKQGQPARQHYTYSKHGSCCVLAAVEPLTGQRTKCEYTQFMQQLAARYPQAERIRLVQDNLNTHALSTFYDCLPAAMAERLTARFEVYYTPKCGSWLNQIKLDFSALAPVPEAAHSHPGPTRLSGLLLELPAPGAGREDSLAVHP